MQKTPLLLFALKWKEKICWQVCCKISLRFRWEYQIQKNSLTKKQVSQNDSKWFFAKLMNLVFLARIKCDAWNIIVKLQINWN